MAIAIDDVMEAAAKGVLRALDARTVNGRQQAATTDPLRSGFYVNVIIRAGGMPVGENLGQVSLNPQPLPPVQGGGFGGQE